MGLYRDDGKDNGNYYSIIGISWGYMDLRAVGLEGLSVRG